MKTLFLFFCLSGLFSSLCAQNELAAQAQRPLSTLDNRDRYGNQVDPSTQPDSLDTSNPNTNRSIYVSRMRLIIRRKDTIKNYSLAEFSLFCLFLQTHNLIN